MTSDTNAERKAMADRLKRARTLAGIKTPSEAARRLRVPSPTYLAHENGSRGFKRPDALKYARAFQVEVEWLLYGTGNPRGPTIMEKIAHLTPEGRKYIEETIDIRLERERRNRQGDLN